MSYFADYLLYDFVKLFRFKVFLAFSLGFRYSEIFLAIKYLVPIVR